MEEYGAFVHTALTTGGCITLHLVVRVLKQTCDESAGLFKQVKVQVKGG